jgi:hypothetical protein
MTRKLYYRAVPQNMEVEKVTEVFDPQTGARRNPAAVDVNQSGRARANREASEEWLQFFVEQGIDPLDAWMTLGTNGAEGIIFVYPAHKTDEGAIAANWDSDTLTYHFHFGSAMKQTPAVRPTTQVEATYEPSLDKEGKPCLAVKIKGARPKRAGAADLEEMAVRAEEETAKKAAKAAARKRIAAAKQGVGDQGGSKSPEGAAGKTPPPTEEA